MIRLRSVIWAATVTWLDSLEPPPRHHATFEWMW